LSALTTGKTNLTYTPLNWQIAAWRDQSPVMLLTGAAGGGKSRVAAEKVHGFMLRYPGATGLVLRKAREWCTKSIVPFLETSVIGRDTNVRKLKSETCFHYKNGGMLFWGGMKNEEQREALRSIGQEGGLDIVWIEEANAFTEADFEELLARMRGHAASWTQIILNTNPDRPTHWIYQRLIKGGQASVHYSGAKDNPYNPPQYLASLDMLTGARRDRLRDGKWTQSEGLVYSDYDASIHLIDPFEIPADWKRYRVADFGYTNPFVMQWWAEDHDGRLYLYREIYHTQRLVEDHAKQIVALSTGEKYVATLADHDAEDRATLARHGVQTTAADKDITTGIQAVQARLKVLPDKKARLYFMRGALVEVDPELERAKKPTCTADEIDGYIWTPPKEGVNAKEVPVKSDDHGMDAMRYLAKYLTIDNDWFDGFPT
jgi:PBSX family phage terminase large subunit